MTPPMHQFYCFGIVIAGIQDYASISARQLSKLVGGVITPPYNYCAVNAMQPLRLLPLYHTRPFFGNI